MTLDPIVLFFVFGLAAGLMRSELRLPSAIYDFLILVLLITIGLKGGVELARQPFAPLVPQIALVILLGLVLPLIAYPVLAGPGRLKRADAASIAAHYGSVSVGTYAVAIAYLSSVGVKYEDHMPLFLVILEMPAIFVGVILARGISRRTRWRAMAHEVFLGKGIVLLTGGLLIGWIAGPSSIEPLEPLFFDLFKGFLALFLLEMGLIASTQMAALRQSGLFLLGFGIAMPLFSGLVGCGLGILLGLSVGGTALLGTLAASASYIAVPAAMRITIPEANPTLSLTASLGVTFPFNVMIGIPLYLAMARWMHGGG